MPKDSRKRPKGDAGRCTKSNSKRRYSKKRKWHGKKKSTDAGDVVVAEEEQQPFINNEAQSSQHVPGATEEIAPENDLAVDSTISKIVNIDADIDNDPPGEDLAGSSTSGYCFIDLSILNAMFNLTACPSCLCTGTLELKDILQLKKGLCRMLKVTCGSCPYKFNFETSKTVNRVIQDGDKNKGGNKHKEVNVRAIYGMRAIGSGHKQLEKFCTFMNMPKPMNITAYNKLSCHLKDTVRKIAEQSMDDVASELRESGGGDDVAVAVDGTWQKRGFTSTLGVVTALSVDQGKVLDCSIMAKSCKGCTRMEKIKATNINQYNMLKANHKCNMNYSGSSPNMEKVGALKLYGNSIDKGLYYTSFYGDGDSKSYTAVKDFYGPMKPVKKYECIGHYQKRVGCRLRKLRVKKNLGGKGRLTVAKIDLMQNYFGIALRQNVGNLQDMKRACMASLQHSCGYHDTCPKDSQTWCQFQKDKQDGTNLYKNKHFLDVDIRRALLPIYIDLCRDDMLSKCLHGKTNNANESYNGMIWNRVPKHTHVGLNNFSFGVYDAIAHFNYGEKATIDVYSALNIDPGTYTIQGCTTINRERKRKRAYQLLESTKKRRKVLRHLKKKKQDKQIEEEGDTYEYGGY